MLASAGWGFYLARTKAGPAAVAALICILFGFLYFDNIHRSPANTYIYLLIPGHHGGFTLLAPFTFIALARCLNGETTKLGRHVATFAVLAGLGVLGDALAFFMFVVPAGFLALLLTVKGKISRRQAAWVLGGCAAAFLIGQAYQQLALYPTAKQYFKHHILPNLKHPLNLIETSLPVFLRDLQEYYFNVSQTGVWFLLPCAGWLIAAGILMRCVIRRRSDAESTDLLMLVPATSLFFGLPATVMLQVLVVGYGGTALSRQFVAFLLLGIVMVLLVAGRLIERLRDRGGWLRIGLDAAIVVVPPAIALGLVLKMPDAYVTRDTGWGALDERADCIHDMAREAGITRLVTNYWIVPPISLKYPQLEVDFYFADINYLEPRVRDPSVYRRGDIEGYVVEPLGVPESRLLELFGPPEKTLTRTTSNGTTLKLLLFPGEKPRSYNQWVTSYSPTIYGDRAFFPASTLAHLQKPQFGDDSYRFEPDPTASQVRAAWTNITLWPGSFTHTYEFSGPAKPKRILVTLLYRGRKVLDAQEATVDPESGRAVVEVTSPTKVDPQTWGELIVEVPVDPRPAPGEAYIFEGLTIERNSDQLTALNSAR
jgi:hypothetical protein